MEEHWQKAITTLKAKETIRKASSESLSCRERTSPSFMRRNNTCQRWSGQEKRERPTLWSYSLVFQHGLAFVKSNENSQQESPRRDTIYSVHSSGAQKWTEKSRHRLETEKDGRAMEMSRSTVLTFVISKKKDLRVQDFPSGLHFATPFSITGMWLDFAKKVESVWQLQTQELTNACGNLSLSQANTGCCLTTIHEFQQASKSIFSDSSYQKLCVNLSHQDLSWHQDLSR